MSRLFMNACQNFVVIVILLGITIQARNKIQPKTSHEPE